MNPDDQSSQPQSGTADRLDDLINAIIDQPENESAWDEFRSLAAQSPEPWQRLSQHQRLARQLGVEFQQAVEPALSVELPARQALPMRRTAPWLPPLRAYVGWAAAILIALGWLINTTLVPASNNATIDRAALLDQYLAQPDVVGELPMKLYRVENGKDGQVVTVVRQILERRKMQMYDLVVEDGLNPVLRPTGTQSDDVVAARY